MKRPWMAFGLMGVLCLHINQAPAAPSATIIFKDFKLTDVQVSPSGRYLSSITDFNGSLNLVILDLTDNNSSAITQFPPPGKVLETHWKSDDTLVYTASGKTAGLEEHDEWAIDRHGKNSVNLWHWLPGGSESGFPGIVDWLPEVPNTVLVEIAKVDSRKKSQPSFYFVERMVIGPGGTPGGAIIAGGRNCQYVVDHDGNPRICLSRETDLSRRLYYRDKANSTWQQLGNFNYDDGKVTPLAFTADNKHLYVLSNSHRETRALFEYDPGSGSVTGPLIEVPGVDLAEGVFGSDGRTLIGVRYQTDREHVYFLDDSMAALQKSMDTAFPGRHVSINSVSQDFGRAIVRVDSAQSPGQFFLYDSAKKSVQKIGDLAPWIDAAQFGPQKPIKFAARDGTSLHGYLTLPPDREAKGLPLILWPMSGASSADIGGWNRVAQFFATRGYAVMRVYHRGAPRFDSGIDASVTGLSLEGIKNDLLDSIDWAVGQGIADKDRVALYGVSFDGYLSLMSMAASPDAYRCGISYGGEINLERLFDKLAISSTLWRERSDAELNFWEKLFGGHRDAAFLKAQSPLYNADKIQKPVFLAYGISDTSVPYTDAEKLKNSLVGAHKTAVLLGKDQEPHLFDKEENNIDLFTQIETFLQGCNPSQ